MLAFLQNPWVVGIGGGIVSGIIVYFITSWLYKRKDNSKYLEQISRANLDIIQALKPYVAERGLPEKEIVDAIADVSAKQITSVMQIEGVNVIEYGRVANAPSSPNVKKNTMLGAIAGIVIAIAVLVVNFILDDRIKTSDDVEKYLGITNLSLIPLTEEEYNGQPSSKKKKTRK